MARPKKKAAKKKDDTDKPKSVFDLHREQFCTYEARPPVRRAAGAIGGQASCTGARVISLGAESKTENYKPFMPDSESAARALAGIDSINIKCDESGLCWLCGERDIEERGDGWGHLKRVLSFKIQAKQEWLDRLFHCLSYGGGMEPSEIKAFYRDRLAEALREQDSAAQGTA